jgi:hypothetical protein
VTSRVNVIDRLSAYHDSRKGITPLLKCSEMRVDA